MTLIVGLAAFSIDVAQWEVGHHKAQVAADATALAAANCLASTRCATTGAATTQAYAVGNDNGFQTSSLTIAYPTVTTVTVKVKATATAVFAGFFGIPSANVSASATASYNTTQQKKWPCASTGASNCISLFAGNNNCPNPAPATNTVGLSLVTNDQGGGNEQMTGLYSNGYYYNGGASGSYAFQTTSPPCATNNEKKPTNTTFTSTGVGAVPYPVVWAQPACDYSATYFTTSSSAPAANQISSPGVYCATGTPTTSCSSTGYSTTAKGAYDYTGYIDVDMSTSTLSSQGYEFVGPCVVLSGSTDNLTNITGEPLVYGTSNTVTSATASALPTCSAAANSGSSGTSTWIIGNGSALDAPIYDQCGTFEDTGNTSNFIGFVEAWNIVLDKNGAVQGDGPTSVTSPTVQTFPGSDSLTG